MNYFNLLMLFSDYMSTPWITCSYLIRDILLMVRSVMASLASAECFQSHNPQSLRIEKNLKCKPIVEISSSNARFNVSFMPSALCRISFFKKNYVIIKFFL